MTRTAVHTNLAPEPIGTYSQAIRIGRTVHLSGQIALDPATGRLIQGGIEEQARRVFSNVDAVARAAGQSMEDVVRVTVYLTDLVNFAVLNKVMAEYFQEPYPARSTVGVAALPRGALVEVDAMITV